MNFIPIFEKVFFIRKSFRVYQRKIQFLIRMGTLRGKIDVNICPKWITFNVKSKVVFLHERSECLAKKWI